MATQPPFPWLDKLASDLASSFRPPAWVIDEAQRRLVLLLNHVLMQEPEATARLIRQKDRVVLAQWRGFSVRFLVTPAGLLDLASPDARPDLSLTVTEESPVAISRALLQGDKPAVRIDGDVQLAAEVSWLVDHVRWDLEEDLSRLIGDAPAHTVGLVVQRMAQALRQFTVPRAGGAGGDGKSA